MRLNGDEKLIFEEIKETFDNPIYLYYNDHKLILSGNNIVCEGETFTDLGSLYEKLRE